MSLLYGLHDREGRHIVPPGGWVVDTIALADNPAPTNYTALRGDINWLVRVNWGYGSTGTIPLPEHDNLFFDRLAHYAHNSPGVYAWIIGNEPNHEQERPNGVYIAPQRYAAFFARARRLIKTINVNHRVLPAPCAPYHANPTPWTEYWHEMLQLIAEDGGCDGLVIHAYTRSSRPEDIASEASMDAPLLGTRSGFLTYRDALQLVPSGFNRLPAYITEFNELLDAGWHDANTGVVQAAYAEIDWWNKQGAFDIHCLCLYRWPKFDQWHIEGKQGVIDDFMAAIGAGYTSPEMGTQTVTETTFIPVVSPGTVAAPQLSARAWDERLTQRGVTIREANARPGEQYWRVKAARWYDERESQGRHHIYVEAVADNGDAMIVPFEVGWPDGGRAAGSTNGRTGFDAGNFPMSKSLNEFSVGIDTELPTEVLVGIGMGDKGNSGVHTSTGVIFELAKMPLQSTTPIPAPPAKVPALVHPVSDPRWRVVTQRFGERPEYYRQFAVDGVPLKGHNGIDFGTPEGTPIVVVDDGQVIETRYDAGGYGLYAKVQHAWGESLYAHLVYLDVSMDARLVRGVQVGLSGNTGNSTGPHLHFGMRVNPFNRQDGWGGYVDPAPYLINVPAPDAPTTRHVIVKAICAAALEFGVDSGLLLSLAWAESSFLPHVESSQGAKGLFQIMPATWTEWGPKVGATDPFVAQDSARVGAAYFAWLLKTLNGDVYDAIVAYNAGIGNVLNNGAIGPQTYQYADKVIFGRDLLKAVGQ